MIASFILVLSIIALGMLCRRTSLFPDNTADILNTFVLYISLPAIIFISTPLLKGLDQALVPVSVHWIGVIVHFLLIGIAWKLFKLDWDVFGALLVVTTMGNTAFVGIPLVESLYGESLLPIAVIVDQTGSGIVFILVGSFILHRFSENAQPRSLAQSFKFLITFPAFLAFLLGLALKEVVMPVHLMTVLKSLAATLTPCAMFAVGFQLKLKQDLSELKNIFIGLSLKLLILPIVLYFVFNLFVEQKEELIISVLQMGMGPMITAGAMATVAKVRPNLSVALVGYGLILSFITLPLLTWIMQ